MYNVAILVCSLPSAVAVSQVSNINDSYSFVRRIHSLYHIRQLLNLSLKLSLLILQLKEQIRKQKNTYKKAKQLSPMAAHVDIATNSSGRDVAKYAPKSGYKVGYMGPRSQSGRVYGT